MAGWAIFVCVAKFTVPFAAIPLVADGDHLDVASTLKKAIY